MAIHLVHGIVEDWCDKLYTHRLYVPAKAFIAHLRNRDVPYTAWYPPEQRGDVLTVDDSTRAGAYACLSARQLGHEVHFFVNPFQIMSGNHYFFSILDTLIDNRTISHIAAAEHRLNLDDPKDLRRFRQLAKSRLMVVPEEEQSAILAELSQILRVNECSPPFHADPITVDDLSLLREAGVRFENHGWTHIEIGALTDMEFQQHVSSADSWLVAAGCPVPHLYAVPFGVTDLSPKRQAFVDRDYFLARSSPTSSRLSATCWNRHDITEWLQEYARCL